MNKKKGKASQKNNKAPKPKAQVSRNRVVQIHPCSRMFLSAVVEPFGHHEEVCLPVGEALSSQKIRCFARGVLSVGLNGVGWLAVNAPFINSWGSLNYTTSAYTGSQATPIANSGIGISNSFLIGSPVTTTPQTWAARHVVTALRIRYVGTELNRGGQTLAWIDREDDNVVGMPYDDIANRPLINTKAVDRKWHVLKYVENAPLMGEFQQFRTVLGAKHRNTAADDWRNMVIFVTGVTGNQFEWEVVSYQEHRYNVSQQMWTHTASDVTGGSTILAEAASPASEQDDAGYDLLGRVERSLAQSTQVLDVIQSGAEYLGRGAAVAGRLSSLFGSLGLSPGRMMLQDRAGLREL